MNQERFYRCSSASSAGDLICGLKHVGSRLSKSGLLTQFERHRRKYPKNKVPTALVSVTDRPIEAMHRAFEKYYNSQERSASIWITIISVPFTADERRPYHHAEMLALATGIKDSYIFRHEYLFEWEIPDQYVEHRISVETLLDRGLNLDDYLKDNSRLPCLEELRSMMIKKARCFGARAPVKEIANQILTDCPRRIFVDYKGQFVKWQYDVLETMDFDHFYWITRGINEAVFDCWLSDTTFLEYFLAHIEWANELTKEMETLWEFYWENL